jgi:hypothetical protein
MSPLRRDGDGDSRRLHRIFPSRPWQTFPRANALIQIKGYFAQAPPQKYPFYRAFALTNRELAMR